MNATTDQLRNGIFQAIERERDYQDEKWGTPDENPHTVAEWILIMQNELHEAAVACVISPGYDAALLELLQVVSVGVACLEEHGVVERNGDGA